MCRWRDEVGCVDRAPAGLGGRAGPGPLGDLRSQTNGRKGRLDGVRGAQVDPVFGLVIDDLLDGLGELRPVRRRTPQLHAGQLPFNQQALNT